MRNLKLFLLPLTAALLFAGCGVYSFSGISISPEVKSFEVRQFTNEALTVIPGLDRDFTVLLQDFILNQTNLNLVTKNGDIVYEGEIINYFEAPQTSVAGNQAAENRLTIGVRLRYFDTTNEENDLEQTFSFFFDFPANEVLAGDTQDIAHETIFERITQDIVNATLAKW